jgi:hypothetical protein
MPMSKPVNLNAIEHHIAGAALDEGAPLAGAAAVELEVAERRSHRRRSRSSP